MIKHIRKSYYSAGASFTAGMLMANDAFADQTFNKIALNMTETIADIPGLLTGLCYMFGLLLFALGIMKVKDHVENPTNTPLKDGSIRLAAGGALFAIPFVTDSMLALISGGNENNTATTDAAFVNKINFNVQ